MCIAITVADHCNLPSSHHAQLLGEIGRILGATWKEMNESQKKPYIDMAERDKQRAEAEKAAYNSAKPTKKGRKAAADSD